MVDYYRHYRYTYPFLRDIPFTITYDKEWWDRRVRHYLTKRMRGDDVGGVFMPTDVKNGHKKRLEKLANEWQDQFPEAIIYWLDADNAKDEYWILEHLQQDTYTDIDLLITSPVWAQGIDIQGKFDLTAGLQLNPQIIHDANAEFNKLTRERQSKEYIQYYSDGWKRYHWDLYEKIFLHTKTEHHQIQQILKYYSATKEEKLKITADDLLVPDSYGGWIRNPNNHAFIDGLLEVAEHELKSKAFATQELPKIAQGYGAKVVVIHNEAQEKKYPYILDEEPYKLNGAEEPTQLKDIATDINRTLGYTAKTMADIYRFKALTNPPRKTIEKLITEIRELIGNEMIITNPQFVLSSTFKKLEKNKKRYEKLLGFSIELNKEYISPLQTLIHILNANGIEAKLQRGNSTQRRALQTKAKGEHSKEFNKWKRTNGVAFKEKHRELTHPVFNGHIQNLTYPLYLWDGLNEGVFDFDDLGAITKDFIKAHDYILIEGGTI